MRETLMNDHTISGEWECAAATNRQSPHLVAGLMRALAKRSTPPRNASVKLLHLWHQARMNRSRITD